MCLGLKWKVHILHIPNILCGIWNWNEKSTFSISFQNHGFGIEIKTPYPLSMKIEISIIDREVIFDTSHDDVISTEHWRHVGREDRWDWKMSILIVLESLICSLWDNVNWQSLSRFGRTPSSRDVRNGGRSSTMSSMVSGGRRRWRRFATASVCGGKAARSSWGGSIWAR